MRTDVKDHRARAPDLRGDAESARSESWDLRLYVAGATPRAIAA
jgi:hypothetical protein